MERDRAVVYVKNKLITMSFYNECDVCLLLFVGFDSNIFQFYHFDWLLKSRAIISSILYSAGLIIISFGSGSIFEHFEVNSDGNERIAVFGGTLDPSRLQ